MPPILIAALACTSDEPLPTTSADPTFATPEPTPPTDVETGTPPIDTGTPPPTVDCSALPPMPARATRLEAFAVGEYAAVHEDFALDPDLGLIGVHLHDDTLQVSTAAAEVERLVPGFNPGTKGVAILADGRLAVVDPFAGAVRIVDPQTGGSEIAAAGLAQPNGITVDAQGALFVSSLSRVVRIDPDGSTATVAEVTGIALDGIAFTPDRQTLYVNEPGGQVFRFTRAQDGSWVGPEPFATLPLIEVSGLVFDVADGMVTDVCGNLYVVGMRGALYRFAPDGSDGGVAEIESNPHELFTAVRFGAGGDFDPHTAYVTSLHGSVFEVPLGVAGAPR